MKMKTRLDAKIQQKFKGECRKLRAYLTQSVSIYNEMAAILDVPAIEIREVPLAKVKKRRK